MPSNWLFIDTNFPTFTGEESPNEKITVIQNYMFMLVEQLRYTLHNLDLSNMNGPALAQYSASLTDPIYTRIEDDEGNITQLSIEATGLAARVSDAEGNITQLEITAKGIASRVSDAEGNISSLQQTAISLTSRISDAEGNVSTLQQTATSLTSRIGSAEGDISVLQQTAKSLTSQISDANGNISILQQTAAGFAAQISDLQGDITTLTATANGLASRVSSAEGNISTLTQTANGLAAQIADAQGDITTLTATATGLASRVSTAEGNISTLQQTATSLTSRISNAEGNISALTQTANGLAAQIADAQGDITTLTATANGLISRVSNAEGNISSLTQTVNGFGLEASNGTSSSRLYLTSNGVAIDSAQISFSGMVTFTDLSTAGGTTIYGGNVSTDSLKVSNLYGTYVYLRDSSGSVQGRITITSASTAAYAVDLTSYGALRLTANSGALYLSSTDCNLGLSGSDVSVGCSYFYPTGTAAYLGYSTKGMWQAVYSYTATIQTSDRNLKHDIEDLPDKYLDFLLSLKPRRYKMNNGTSDRYHVGFIAQEVEEAMELYDISSLEFAGFIKDMDEDGNDIYMLRYEEFMAIHTLAIQRIYQKLEAAGL